MCLVACKSKKIQDKYADQIMFPLERRYNPLNDLKAQCEFVTRWKCSGDCMDNMVINYIKRRKYEKVYIVGYEDIGIVLENLLRLKEIDYTVIKTEKRPVTENLFLESGIMPEIDFSEDEKKKVVCILTIWNSQREIMKFEKKQSEFYDMIYIDTLIENEEQMEIIDQIKDTFQNCSNVYIYGVGVNGYNIFNILKENAIEVNGFVVSDNYYNKERGDNVYRISDVSRDSGIVISSNNDREIKKILDELNFTNCFDGKILLNRNKENNR